MNKKRAKLLLIVTSCIFVLGLVLSISSGSSISADSDLGTKISEKSFDLDLNGHKINFIAALYTKGGQEDYYLFQKSLFKTKSLKLMGFEDNIDLYDAPKAKLGSGEYLCLVGEVGAHSKNIQFIGSDLSVASFMTSGISAQNIVTDNPSYQIIDYDNDGIDDLLVDMRDYDKNPLLDIIRSYYNGGKDGFSFDKVENLAVK